VVQLLCVDGLDLVDVEVELGGLAGNPAGNALQLGVAAPHDRASASALRRAIILAETSLVVAS